MQVSGAAWIEMGMVAAGTLGLLVLLAPPLGCKPRQTEQGWLFPVKLTCLLAFWAGFALGLGTVAYAGHSLLASTNWGGWASFTFGFVLVLLVVSHWPAPLLFTPSGVLKQGSPASRIRWEELAFLRQYQIRNDRGLVIHSVYGKQLVVAEMTYDSSQVLDRLMELCPVPLHSIDEEPAPSILQSPVPKVPLPHQTYSEVSRHARLEGSE